MPFQCVLQHQVANPHLATHMATQNDNNHAAITCHHIAICNQRCNKRIESCTHEPSLIAEHRGGTDRARFDRSRTRRIDEVPFIAGRSHFTRKNARFPAPATAPAFSQNQAHATSMQRLQCVLQHQDPNPHLSTHMATQNDNNHAAITCHYIAICNQRSNKRKESRTHELPLLAEHRGGTDRPRFDRSRTRRIDEVASIAGRSHFTRKNARFPAPATAPAFSQNQAHATSMQRLQCVLQHQDPNPHLSTHMATQNDNNHAAVTLRSATRVLNSHTTIH